MNLMEFKYRDWTVTCSNMDMVNNQYRVIEKRYIERMWVFDSFEQAKEKFVQRVAYVLEVYYELFS